MATVHLCNTKTCPCTPRTPTSTSTVPQNDPSSSVKKKINKKSMESHTKLLKVIKNGFQSIKKSEKVKSQSKSASVNIDLVNKTHKNGAPIAGYMEKQLKSIQVRQSQWDLEKICEKTPQKVIGRGEDGRVHIHAYGTWGKGARGRGWGTWGRGARGREWGTWGRVHGDVGGGEVS